MSEGHSVSSGISSSPILKADNGIAAGARVAVPMLSIMSTVFKSISATDKLVTGRCTLSPSLWSLTKTGLM